MTEGILLKWQVKVGDRVAVGDLLAELETENATIEMAAFDEGTIGALYVQEGTRGTPGETLAVLLEEFSTTKFSEIFSVGTRLKPVKSKGTSEGISMGFNFPY